MPAPAEVIELVEQFRENRDVYVSDSFNETSLRRQFIDPMFELLGWDVLNRLGHAEVYKEVVHEDSLKIGGSTKSPDDSFRVGRERKSFVETKKPSVHIKQDIAPAFYQLATHKNIAAVKTAHERTGFQRQAEATDREIDQWVYDLYGLTDDEIRIVEDATAAVNS
jgi:hypothetical protein